MNLLLGISPSALSVYFISTTGNVIPTFSVEGIHIKNEIDYRRWLYVYFRPNAALKSG